MRVLQTAPCNLCREVDLAHKMHRRERGLHAFVACRKVPPRGAPLLGCGVDAVKDVYVELGSTTEGEERAQVLAELEGAVFAEDNHPHWGGGEFGAGIHT